jgi:hypothetical protein
VGVVIAITPAKLPAKVFRFLQRVGATQRLGKREREAKNPLPRFAAAVEKRQVADSAWLALMKVC